MFVCCECCVLSGRGLCDELITRTEEPYQMWCVVVCDLETSKMRRQWPALGRRTTKKKHWVDMGESKILWDTNFSANFQSQMSSESLCYLRAKDP
jgi:hypothetical protein